MRSLVPLVLLFLLAAPGLAQDGHAGHEGHSGHEQPAGHEGHQPATTSPQAGETPSDLAEIQVAPDRQQLIGVKVAKAEVGPLSATVRASAIVEADETKDVHVHTKLMGWVQELFVNAVGQRVQKGEPLYSLYSQDLFAAEQEYLRARKTAPDLAKAARERLRLWDVPEDQVKRIETKGAQKAIVFRSPIAGTVIEKSVLQGHYVEPGMMLYRIADLSTIWIAANVYEFEVNRIAVGGKATVQIEGLLDPIEAAVDYVYPTIDETTRTVKVRLVAPNPRGLLRPGSFATAELPTRTDAVVWVPDSAIIDTGTRQVVYLALADGHFRPVLVRVGRRAEGKAEIREGLKGGESVVVSAQFLLDSESRLRGASHPAGHEGHQ